MRAACALALLALSLTGCATIDGVGQDVETGGEAISELSREVRNDL